AATPLGRNQIVKMVVREVDKPRTALRARAARCRSHGAAHMASPRGRWLVASTPRPPLGDSAAPPPGSLHPGHNQPLQVGVRSRPLLVLSSSAATADRARAGAGNRPGQ